MEHKIKWTIEGVFDDAGDGHTYFHYATGKDESGNEYSGAAVMVDGELDDMQDIIKTSKQNNNHE